MTTPRTTAPAHVVRPAVQWLLTALAACSQPTPAPGLSATTDAAMAKADDVAIADLMNADVQPVPTASGCALPPCGTPKLKAEPAQLAFPWTSPGNIATAAVTISNMGTGPWGLQRIELEADPSFLATCGTIEAAPGKPGILSPPWLLQPGLQVMCQVTFSPVIPDPTKAELRFVPLQEGVPALVVPIGADQIAPPPPAKPCLELLPTVVNFGYVPLGATKGVGVQVHNCGKSAVLVTGWQILVNPLSSSGFQAASQIVCNGQSATTCSLAADASVSVLVAYSPTKPNALDAAGATLPDQGTFLVTWDAGPAQSVQLTGVTIDSLCPVAKVSVKEGLAVVPQTSLHLKGDGSSSPSGAAIKTWSWTVKQPAGSYAKFSPNKTFPNPSLKADVAGEYEFCLDVTDDMGAPSCKTACVKVLVVPDNAIHLELLWDTPADADQSDPGPAAGADMDLHFTHKMAEGPDLDCDGGPDPWFSNPFDCFWFNPNPNWGSTNPAALDDPSLDLDDADGAGPENLNLAQPEGTQDDPHAYGIGVHYWNDHGFGVSYATVTIFMQGVVTTKFVNVKMNPQDMWYVGKLNWPNQLTGSNLPPVTTCFQTGDACLAQSDPANPKGGKMWALPSAKNAQFCMTPCYKNALFIDGIGAAGKPVPACVKP